MIQIFSSNNVQFCHGHRTISQDMLDSREVSEHIHSICEEGVPNESMSDKHLIKHVVSFIIPYLPVKAP